MSNRLLNEGEAVTSQDPTPEKAMGTTEAVRSTTRLGKQRQITLTPIPMDRVMQSNTRRMHMEEPEMGMKVAQIITETVIERNESETSMFFNAPLASSNTLVFENSAAKLPMYFAKRD